MKIRFLKNIINGKNISSIAFLFFLTIPLWNINQIISPQSVTYIRLRYSPGLNYISYFTIVLSTLAYLVTKTQFKIQTNRCTWIMCILNIKKIGWWTDGTMDKGFGRQVWVSEFNPLNPHSERKNWPNYNMSSDIYIFTISQIPTCAHAHNK